MRGRAFIAARPAIRVLGRFAVGLLVAALANVRSPRKSLSRQPATGDPRSAGLDPFRSFAMKQNSSRRCENSVTACGPKSP